MTKRPISDDSVHNVPILGVSEISLALKRTVEQTFERVRVRGEISGFKRAASGHLYFALKDDQAVLDGVCWRGTAGRLGVAPEDGMEVIVTGRLTTYAARSRYQMVVEAMELAGEGALLKLLEDRRRKLAAEGLFDPENKREIPFLPDVIGVVTSPTGAVIRDILHRISDRFPRRVIIWPVVVQGNDAARQISEAIDGFNRLKAGAPVPRPDVIIVARGGGSLEDLMAFNEEAVVRAAAASKIPLISAIGHETDTTLIDHAADVRAPTPTAAAEMAVPVRVELQGSVMDLGTRLVSSMGRGLSDRRIRLQGLSRGLPDLGRVLGEASQRLDDWAERLRNSLRGGLLQRRAALDRLAARIPHPKQNLTYGRDRLAGQTRALGGAMERFIRDRATQLRHSAALLDSYSHQKVLERGFVLVRGASGVPVLSALNAQPGAALSLQFCDGNVGVTVDDDGRPEAKPPGRGGKGGAKAKTSAKIARSAGRSAGDDRQGKLI